MCTQCEGFQVKPRNRPCAFKNPWEEDCALISIKNNGEV